jgi:UDP:flavonoid glycosyltransferase YjiC (YdhE family)
MVAHGGAGTTLAALAAGVPLVLLPLSADQPINARRVAELGAGLALDGGRADVPKLADALARVLEEPCYGTVAGRVAAEVGLLPPVAEAAADLTAIAQLQRAA